MHWFTDAIQPSQNLLRPRWVLLCQRSHPWFSFSRDSLMYLVTLFRLDMKIHETLDKVNQHPKLLLLLTKFVVEITAYLWLANLELYLVLITLKTLLTVLSQQTSTVFYLPKIILNYMNLKNIGVSFYYTETRPCGAFQGTSSFLCLQFIVCRKYAISSLFDLPWVHKGQIQIVVNKGMEEVTQK